MRFFYDDNYRIYLPDVRRGEREQRTLVVTVSCKGDEPYTGGDNGAYL
jgi:hypothetical protein